MRIEALLAALCMGMIIAPAARGTERIGQRVFWKDSARPRVGTKDVEPALISYPATVTKIDAALGLTWTAAAAKLPPVETAFSLVPHVQKDVDIDRPDADTAMRCTVAQDRFGGASALVVRDPAGVILRAFTAVTGDRVVDQWIFLEYGVEVYRDIDSDDDAKADRSRLSPGREAAGSPAAVVAGNEGRPFLSMHHLASLTPDVAAVLAEAEGA